MSAFSGQLRTFAVTVAQNEREVFVNTVSRAYASIVDGDPATGAPGSPVDTGTLRASWQTVFEDEHTAIIGTNVEYAPFVEEGIGRGGRPVQYRVGGPHGVALTFNALPAIVDQEARKVAQ